MAYDFFKSPQTPVDFSPIVQGATAAAQLRARAAEIFAQSFAGGMESASRERMAKSQQAAENARNQATLDAAQARMAYELKFNKQADLQKQAGMQSFEMAKQQQQQQFDLGMEEVKSGNQLLHDQAVAKGFAENTRAQGEQDRLTAQYRIDAERNAELIQQQQSNERLTKAFRGISLANNVNNPDKKWSTFQDLSLSPKDAHPQLAGLTNDEIKALVRQPGMEDSEVSAIVKSLTQPSKQRVYTSERWTQMEARLRGDLGLNDKEVAAVQKASMSGTGYMTEGDYQKKLYDIAESYIAKARNPPSGALLNALNPMAQEMKGLEAEKIRVQTELAQQQQQLAARRQAAAELSKNATFAFKPETEQIKAIEERAGQIMSQMGVQPTAKQQAPLGDDEINALIEKALGGGQ